MPPLPQRLNEAQGLSPSRFCDSYGAAEAAPAKFTANEQGRPQPPLTA
jgi:hypothetical protein